MRGRMVKLGPALDGVVGPHGYPIQVSRLLAEAVSLAAALAGALKYDGIFTLQIQGKGPISLVVADVTSDGALRGYARYDEVRLGQLGKRPSTRALLGDGYLAFTVDQGADTDRYQGIVELTGGDLADCARAYFQQSEQLATEFRMAVAEPDGDAGWRAGVIMLQRMPLGANSPIFTAEEAAEAWNRAGILLGSTKDGELTDPELAAEGMVYRLYHAEGLQVFDAKPLKAQCRCSAQRVEGTLKSFPREQVEDMVDASGDVVVTCEFCKTPYVFRPSDLDRLYAP